MELIHLKQPAPREENIQKFMVTCESVARPGFIKLLDYLVKHTDFFTAPASTKYHGSYPGGLLQHSLNVFSRLLPLMATEAEANGTSATLKEDAFNRWYESIVIVSLFHDICKTNSYVVSKRNVKTGNKLPNGRDEWVEADYYEFSPEMALGHGEKSVILLERFITLTREETEAILYHMGDYTKQSEMSFVYNRNLLALMLHLADMQATYIDEACVPARVAKNEPDEVVRAAYEEAKGRIAAATNCCTQEGTAEGGNE